MVCRAASRACSTSSSCPTSRRAATAIARKMSLLSWTHRSASLTQARGSSRASSRPVTPASRCKQGGGGEADGGAGPGVEHERVPLSSPPVEPSSLQRLAFSFFLAMNPLVTGLSPFVGDGGFWVHGFRDVSNGLALLRNEAR